MKAVIMAGGFGTRISEKSATKPKPMVEIGHRSILWHILKIYSAHGINDFVICMGYKGHVIKKFFANYFLSMADVIFNLAQNKMEMHQTYVEPWRITLVDTGEATMTGGQLKRVREHLGSETFCITCGDGVTNQDISQIIALNRQQKKLATLSAVQPPGRFGAFTLGDDQSSIAHFREKLEGDGAWINGGFFVLEPKVIDHIQDDTTVWEREPMQNMARAGQLAAYKHAGFWQSMDTLRDKMLLEDLWAIGTAPGKVWKSIRPAK